MEFNLKETAAFGVAGNFTGHLEQAGEDKDFKNIEVKEESAPKAIFPTYIPGFCKNVPSFLGTFPFDSNEIIFPQGERKVQIESECAVIFSVEWDNSKIKKLTPLYFGASNDCSIRKEGARKISEKKNWGAKTKGFSSHIIPIDSFDEKGILQNYRIASFLIRDSKVYMYGEDSAVKDYSYIYGKLTDWMIEKFNFQQDTGPAENINAYLNECRASQILVSIGATRYTDFGEHNFLKNGDKAAVILYPGNKYTLEQITLKLRNNDLNDDDISALVQTVIL